MPPAADWAVDSPNVYDAGSAAPATWTKIAWRTTDALTSTRTSDQPGGPVMVGAPRLATAASMTSPATTPAGRVRTSDVVARLSPELAARIWIPVPGGAPASVVKDQLSGTSALAFGEVSAMPLVIRAVYVVDAASAAEGTSVAVRVGAS